MAAVVILLGSASDREKVFPCLDILRDLQVDWDIHITSAHRTPRRTDELVEQAEKGGAKVFICAAGMAAHLAGAVAARTIRPVIGVPLAASALNGMDALLSTVQMPPGYPVATMGLDAAGSRNAAWFAASILALEDSALAGRITAARSKMAESVAAASEKMRAELNL